MLIFALPFTCNPFYQLTTSSESLSQSDIERIGQFTLPPSAKNVRAYYESWMDFSLFVHFDMAPGDVDVFIEGTLVKRPLWDTEIPHDIGSAQGHISWWNPGTPQHFEAGGTNWRPMFATTLPVESTLSPAATAAPSTHPTVEQVFLIDQTNPSQYTVWISVTNAMGS